MRFALLGVLLLGCKTDIQLTYYTDVCQDWDLNQPDPEMRVEKVDGDVVVPRMGVEKPCSAVFRPTIQAAGWRVQIFENWEIGEDDECNLCFGPTVVLETPPDGDYTIQWFPGPNVIKPVHEETVVVGD